MRPTTILASVVLASFLSACGSDEGGSSGGVLVTAAEGGTVEVSGSETRLVIPPAALTADTEISVSFGRLDDFAPLDNARDRVLVMAPEGTVLSRSASLTFDPGEPALGGFEYVTIRQYVDGGWYPPEQSSAEIGSGGLVAASIDLLAPTALVVLEADGG